MKEANTFTLNIIMSEIYIRIKL